jgi:hypothetical protein
MGVKCQKRRDTRGIIPLDQTFVLVRPFDPGLLGQDGYVQLLMTNRATTKS